MLVRVGNVTTRVIQAEEAELKWLSKVLSITDNSFKARVFGSGKISLYNEHAKTFPSGLLRSLQKRAKVADKKIKVVDDRVAPVKADPLAIIDWLRPHQQEAVEVAKKQPRGVFHHVTGAGKTEIMVALTEVFDTKWIILVHKKDLLYQTAARFLKRTGEQVGIVGDGHFDLSQRVTIAMFQSLYKALQGTNRRAVQTRLRSIAAMAVDECHVTPASTFWKVTTAMSGAYYRYGFSGTPFARGDEKSIYTVAAIGKTIHRIAAAELIEKGHLAKPKIQLVPVHHRQPVPQPTWAKVYTRCIINSKDRNKALLRIALLATKPALLFVKEIKHGKLLEKSLRMKGVKVEFVWGKHITPVRQAAIRRLVHGDVDVLICNVIFQEGVDIPELQSVIIGSGGKSAIMVLQNTGRGTRRHSSDGKVTKDEFTVWDIQDKGCGCRGHHKSCAWLEKHTRERLSAYAMEKYPVFVKTLDRRE